MSNVLGSEPNRSRRAGERVTPSGGLGPGARCGWAWRLSWVAAAGLGLGFALTAPAAVADLFQERFEQPPEQACLSLRGNAHVSGGLLVNASEAGWQRSGLEVGPLPLARAAVTVTYDFRPTRFGAQGQSFVSQTPSTHWYMLYANPNGVLRLHTRLGGKWEGRGQSQEHLKLNAWYRNLVTLSRTSFRAVITERDSGQLVWDTGTVGVDDVGETTVCMLTDETPGAVEAATDWDDLRLSTDDAEFAAQFRAEMARLAETKARRRREQQAAATAAADLRQRGLALVPIPQQIRFGSGSCRLAPVRIGFAPELDAAAAAVAAILAEHTGQEPRLEPNGSDGIVLRAVASGPWPVAKTRPTEGYRILVTAKRVQVEAQDRAGFLAAAQTLAQLLGDRTEVPACEIVDWPAIENRLVMVAVSQGGFQVIDVDYWKRLIRELAAVKINMLMPYEEGGTFYYEKYPFMGIKGRDGFTGDKARLLSEYAWQHGIEITPQQQTLGHAGNMLGHKELAHLRENGNAGLFCSTKPEVFAFLGELFDELVTAFPRSRYIHVGGDEFAHGFAECPTCKAQAEQIGKDGLYAGHMMHLRQMLAERNRKLMLWWHEQGFTESAADRLAKDITVFDWHYGNQSSYPSLAKLTGLGFVAWATPAVTRYYSSPNDFDATFGNIRGFLTQAAEEGIEGECTCTWVHGIWGGRNFFELNLYALVYSGQCAWKPANADEDDFRSRFGRHWFGLTGDTVGDEVYRAWHAPFGPAREQGFWKDAREAEPRLAATPAETIADLAKTPDLPQAAERLLAVCGQTRGILERWQKQAQRNQATVDFLLHDVHVYETVARRLLLFRDLPTAYAAARAAPQRQAALAPVCDRLAALIEDYREMERMFDRSIKEAGGAKCGRGSFSGGEVTFRAPQGRAELEKLLARLKGLDPAAADWPETAW